MKTLWKFGNQNWIKLIDPLNLLIRDVDNQIDGFRFNFNFKCSFKYGIIENN